VLHQAVYRKVSFAGLVNLLVIMLREGLAL